MQARITVVVQGSIATMYLASYLGVWGEGHIFVSKIHHNFFDIQPYHVTMKLDSIVFQFMVVIDSLPTLLCAGACSPRCPLLIGPNFKDCGLVKKHGSPGASRFKILTSNVLI